MAEDNEKTSKNREYTDKTGKFKKGNPGKPKGAKSYLTLLEEALDKEAQEAGITYWERLAQWCFTNPKSAVAVLKKFIPDKTQTELSTPEPIAAIFKVITNEDNKDDKDIPMADREQEED